MKEIEGISYLFGYPLKHSLSPLVHNTTFENLGIPCKMTALESLDLPGFLQLTQEPRFFGAAVTMPHKVSIMGHLDEIDSAGRDVGACNTIYVTAVDGERKLCGTNTDCVGIREAFARNVPDALYHGRPGLVVGGGGASRAAVYALKKWIRCATIYLVNRDRQEIDDLIEHFEQRGLAEGLVFVESVEQAEALQGPGAIVSCVPNFPPTSETERTARNVLETFLSKEHKGALLEMCYHPTPWTEIADLSQRAGWQVVLGTEPLIYQGLEQDKYWTSRPFEDLPVSKVKEAVADALEAFARTLSQ
ncbi:Shikimate dehydrogenase substrate binding domain-containing protein [Cladophialophora immunda]|nr:Shikimate dehydrogenase substrate binding domain-containing protein [Cladophialophora immunda]